MNVVSSKPLYQHTSLQRSKTQENPSLKNTWRVNLEVYGLIFVYVLADLENPADRLARKRAWWRAMSERLILMNVSHHRQKALKLGKQYCPSDGSDIVQPY